MNSSRRGRSEVAKDTEQKFVIDIEDNERKRKLI